MTARAAACALVLVSAVTLARAEPVRDAELRFEIELPAGWALDRASYLAPEGRAVGREPGSATGRLYGNPDTEQAAAVVRIDGPTQGAWLDDAEFFAGIEAGVKKQLPDHQRRSRAKSKLRGVPALDLWFRRGDRLIGIRFLFYRTYALSLTVDTPARHQRSAARLLTSFQPPK